MLRQVRGGGRALVLRLVNTVADFSLSFYNSKVWKECRKAYAASVLHLCEVCKQPGYILHHKIHLTPDNINDPEVTLEWHNLKFVCIPCHNIEHGIVEPVRDDVMFDASGDLVRR